MSEAIKRLTEDERRVKIQDIRERKGHLFGRGIIISGSNPGFVPGLPPIDEMKYSVLVSGDDGFEYVYKGVPETSVRHVPADVSEYTHKRRPLRNLESLVDAESNDPQFAQVTDDGAFVAQALKRAAEIKEAQTEPIQDGWFFCRG